MIWMFGTQARRAVLAAMVLAGATVAVSGSSASACDQCQRAAMLQQREAAYARAQAVAQMYDENALNFLFGSPQAVYRPRQAPPGWEAIENNRRIMSRLYGPGGLLNTERLLRNLQ